MKALFNGLICGPLSNAFPTYLDVVSPRKVAAGRGVIEGAEARPFLRLSRLTGRQTPLARGQISIFSTATPVDWGQISIF
jgi:hypothetical protein